MLSSQTQPTQLDSDLLALENFKRVITTGTRHFDNLEHVLAYQHYLFALSLYLAVPLVLNSEEYQCLTAALSNLEFLLKHNIELTLDHSENNSLSFSSIIKSDVAHSKYSCGLKRINIPVDVVVTVLHEWHKLAKQYHNENNLDSLIPCLRFCLIQYEDYIEGLVRLDANYITFQTSNSNTLAGALESKVKDILWVDAETAIQFLNEIITLPAAKEKKARLRYEFLLKIANIHIQANAAQSADLDILNQNFFAALDLIDHIIRFYGANSEQYFYTCLEMYFAIAKSISLLSIAFKVLFLTRGIELFEKIPEAFRVAGWPSKVLKLSRYLADAHFTAAETLLKIIPPDYDAIDSAYAHAIRTFQSFSTIFTVKDLVQYNFCVVKKACSAIEIILQGPDFFNFNNILALRKILLDFRTRLCFPEQAAPFEKDFYYSLLVKLSSRFFTFAERYLFETDTYTIAVEFFAVAMGILELKPAAVDAPQYESILMLIKKNLIYSTCCSFDICFTYLKAIFEHPPISIATVLKATNSFTQLDLETIHITTHVIRSLRSDLVDADMAAYIEFLKKLNQNLLQAFVLSMESHMQSITHATSVYRLEFFRVPGLASNFFENMTPENVSKTIKNYIEEVRVKALMPAARHSLHKLNNLIQVFDSLIDAKGNEINIPMESSTPLSELSLGSPMMS